MKLIYRGTTYNYDPAKLKARIEFPKTDQSAYELIYRGSTYLFDPSIAKLASVKPNSYELIYRGSTYQVNRNEAGEVTAITCSTDLFNHKTLATRSAMPKAADRHLL